MIEHVYRRASEARSVSSVIVATDDERIQRAVLAFGGSRGLTSPDHPSGTDRLAEVAASLTCDIVVNVQGDEPLIEPAIDRRRRRAASQTIRRSRCPRFAGASISQADIDNPNITKVVVDRDGFALYFSRAPIPYVRSGTRRRAPGATSGSTSIAARACCASPRSRRRISKRSEALEQLRALEHGIRIKAIETSHEAIGVDTPDDLERVRRL